ncbi:MFS transporter [Amycolatopsis pithecellobii]|uniref:MFS transporter n=1 Tax=Amycolatopsis pithecellobii TaxID=664692 RepID=A0A6N7YMV7_9PSEU|nr:MFS transporter [Amycolatopsis pithecellobii]MTD53352.1 MFS transporter [Amycolatopsis pithecellobii]
MPFAIFVLAATVFSMNTTEVMVSGLVPGLTQEFGVSVAAVGYLVSAYAVGMAIGAPILTVGMLRFSRKAALIGLVATFVAGQTIAALAPAYAVLFGARILTALAAGAFFGTAASVCVSLVGAQNRGRALSVVFGGLMVAQVAGLPAATFAQQHLGWRASFWGVDGLALVCLIAIVAAVPRTPAPGRIDIRAELGAFRNGRLWVAYATNALSVGAVFATFSYLFPVLTELSGFSAAAVPLLFLVYGLATVIGNIVVGRLADRHNVGVLAYGQLALVIVLACFAVFAGDKVAAVCCLVVLGLVGLPLSSARGARIMAVSNNRPLISTVATSMVNVGIILGPWLGGLALGSRLSYHAPMWIGAVLAIAGLLSVVPAVLETRRATGEPALVRR